MSRTRMIFAAALLGGCASSVPQTKMVAVGSVSTSACAADVDCGTQQLCVDAGCRDVSAQLTACGDMEVHFATKSADIDANNRAALDRTAICLRKHKEAHVSLGGNADERGTPDFNRDLAQRRADAVATYLSAQGVPAAQLMSSSYGADNPECAEHDTECWKANRRVNVQPRGMRVSDTELRKNKLTTDDNAKNGNRIDSTGSGEANGSSVGK